MFSKISVPYATTTQLVVSLTSFLLVYGIYKILAFVYADLTSPLRNVPGPPNSSLIYGNFKQVSESVSSKAYIVLVSDLFQRTHPERFRVAGGLDKSIWTDYQI